MLPISENIIVFYLSFIETILIVKEQDEEVVLKTEVQTANRQHGLFAVVTPLLFQEANQIPPNHQIPLRLHHSQPKEKHHAHIAHNNLFLL